MHDQIFKNYFSLREKNFKLPKGWSIHTGKLQHADSPRPSLCLPLSPFFSLILSPSLHTSPLDSCYPRQSMQQQQKHHPGAGELEIQILKPHPNLLNLSMHLARPPEDFHGLLLKRQCCRLHIFYPLPSSTFKKQCCRLHIFHPFARSWATHNLKNPEEPAEEVRSLGEPGEGAVPRLRLPGLEASGFHPRSSTVCGPGTLRPSHSPDGQASLQAAASPETNSQALEASHVVGTSAFATGQIFHITQSVGGDTWHCFILY